jgi:hypothetical protein
MTDQAFFDGLNQLAEELLGDFGQMTTLRRVTKSKPNAAGKVVKTTVDSPGRAVMTSNVLVVGQLNGTFDAAFVAKFPVAVEDEDDIFMSGTWWKVTSLKRVSPEGNRIIVTFIGATKL